MVELESLQPVFPEFIDILIPGNNSQRITQNKASAGVALVKGDFELVEKGAFSEADPAAKQWRHSMGRGEGWWLVVRNWLSTTQQQLLNRESSINSSQKARTLRKHLLEAGSSSLNPASWVPGSPALVLTGPSRQPRRTTMLWKPRGFPPRPSGPRTQALPISTCVLWTSTHVVRSLVATWEALMLLLHPNCQIYTNYFTTTLQWGDLSCISDFPRMPKRGKYSNPAIIHRSNCLGNSQKDAPGLGVTLECR